MKPAERVMEHPTLRCDKCSQLYHQPVRYEEYFLNQEVICSSCSKAVDLFRMISDALSQEIFPWESFHLVGAQTSYLPIQIEPKKIYPLKFSDHGIPEDALILQVNFTVCGDGGLYPLQFDKSLRQAGRFLPSFMPLYPSEFFHNSEQPVSTTDLQVFVTWIRHSSDDFALSNLVDAFYYYHQGEYAKAMIPANVAVEEPLKRLCAKWLSEVAGSDRVKRFLQDAATYSHQVNVLMLMLAKVKGQPLLPDDLRGKLNRIRNLRNDAAHDGRIPADLSKEEASSLVAAALLAHVYVRWVERNI